MLKHLPLPRGIGDNLFAESFGLIAPDLQDSHGFRFAAVFLDELPICRDLIDMLGVNGLARLVIKNGGHAVYSAPHIDRSPVAVLFRNQSGLTRDRLNLVLFFPREIGKKTV